MSGRTPIGTAANFPGINPGPAGSHGAMKSHEPFSKPMVVLSWLARLVVAAILLQTLYFKFSGAAESVYIFTAVGQEPWGRYGSGVVELAASVLLFLPGTVAVGALLALGTMSGAIFFHLTKLGIVVQDDGGLLFGLAITVFVSAAFLLWLHRRTLPLVGAHL
jgi:putative oxidoreductase